MESINKEDKRAFISVILVISVVLIVILVNYKNFFIGKNPIGGAYSSKCSDTDGIDKNSMGIVTFIGKQYPDRCTDSLTLMEFYCYGAALKKVEMHCDYKCSTGKLNNEDAGYCSKKPCSDDTKQCPDNTFTGRNPENDCEFFPCPKSVCPDITCDRVVNEKDLAIVTNALNKGILACELCDLNFDKRIDNKDTSIIVNSFNKTVNCASEKCCIEGCADINCNSMIDKWDMQLITDNWEKPNMACPRCDINKDNIINIDDLKVISNNYNKKTSEVCK